MASNIAPTIPREQSQISCSPSNGPRLRRADWNIILAALWGPTLYVSAHSDDAAIEMGFSLLAGILPEPLFLVTVFSRSTHTVIQHSLAARQVEAVRLREDRRFCRQVGARFIAMRLRDWLPRHRIDAWRRLAVGQIVRRLDALVNRHGIRFLVVPFPSGSAHHHHEVVRDAALELAARRTGLSVLLTNDLPYSVNDPTRPLFAAGQRYEPVVVEFGPDGLSAKLATILAYESQCRPHYLTSVAIPCGPCRYSETLWVPQNIGRAFRKRVKQLACCPGSHVP